MSGYDTALTIFSPNGHLFQVEYATEAVKRGFTSVAVTFKDGVILAVEKKSSNILQVQKNSKKLVHLDENLCCAFSGLNADARILLNMTRVHCQSYRLNYDEPPTAKQVAQYVADVQQKHTQKGGVRPFGVATIIAGFDNSQMPHVYVTDPSGMCSEWTAAVIGKGQKQVLEFLEKEYKQGLSKEEGLIVVCKAMKEVAESTRNNLDFCILTMGKLQFLTKEEINTLSDIIDQQ